VRPPVAVPCGAIDSLVRHAARSLIHTQCQQNITRHHTKRSRVVNAGTCQRALAVKEPAGLVTTDGNIKMHGLTLENV